jgi:H+/gluconate symporter-like permease
MIVLLVTGIVPPVVAGLLAAGAMVLLGVLSMPQAYRAISWTTVVLVGGMIPLSIAMQETGAAERLAHLLVDLAGGGSPYLLLFGLALLTAALGQLISNTATALIVIPIAVSAAADTGVSVRPLLMAVTVAAAASFLSEGAAVDPITRTPHCASPAAVSPAAGEDCSFGRRQTGTAAVAGGPETRRLPCRRARHSTRSCGSSRKAVGR